MSQCLCTSTTANDIVLSCAAVGLADSSRPNHSLVGTPLCATLPLMDPFLFLVKCSMALWAFFLSVALESLTNVGLKHFRSCGCQTSLTVACFPCLPNLCSPFSKMHCCEKTSSSECLLAMSPVHLPRTMASVVERSSICSGVWNKLCFLSTLILLTV